MKYRLAFSIRKNGAFSTYRPGGKNVSRTGMVRRGKTFAEAIENREIEERKVRRLVHRGKQWAIKWHRGSGQKINQSGEREKSRDAWQLKIGRCSGAVQVKIIKEAHMVFY